MRREKAGRYLGTMLRLPRWVPRNPGCGCLAVLLVALVVLLLHFDGN
jgi:hypothetical protein